MHLVIETSHSSCVVSLCIWENYSEDGVTQHLFTKVKNLPSRNPPSWSCWTRSDRFLENINWTRFHRRAWNRPWYQRKIVFCCFEQEMHEAPASPSLSNSIMKCDVDIRRDLCRNDISYVTRNRREISKRIHFLGSFHFKSKSLPAERTYSVWNVSILLINHFQEMWITKKTGWKDMTSN